MSIFIVALRSDDCDSDFNNIILEQFLKICVQFYKNN